MAFVRPKKNLGQHFLKDKSVADKIAASFIGENCNTVLEIGPGTGILTGALLRRDFPDFRVIEIDNESVYYLKSNFPDLKNIISGDFLTLDLGEHFKGCVSIIGNFPYNISSQILFRVIENRNIVPEVCCMLQKEVAERICAKPGSKSYGILSVLIQTYYSAAYLFTVQPGVFVPPPKVQSGVIRLLRNEVMEPGCDEKLFFRVVKSCFNQRRKTLRNSVRSAFAIDFGENEFFGQRPEQLTISQFVDLTNLIAAAVSPSE